MIPFGTIWDHFGPFGTTWHNLGPFGTIWDYLEPVLSIKFSFSADWTKTIYSETGPQAFAAIAASSGVYLAVAWYGIEPVGTTFKRKSENYFFG